MKDHKRLDVWKHSMDFVTFIYKLTESYPKSERFSLISQLRRAAISIPSNIAEGVARRSSREYVQFLYTARGSISELDTQLEISRSLGYITDKVYGECVEELDLIGKMLNGLINSIERRIERGQ